MDYTISLPNHPSLPLVLRPGGLFRGARILYEGRDIERKDGKYTILLPDNSIVRLGLKISWDLSAPHVQCGDKVIDVVPPLPAYQIAFAFLPLLLIFVGGAIGGLCGAGGHLGIVGVFRSQLPLAARVILALLIAAASAVAYLGLASLFRMAIS